MQDQNQHRITTTLGNNSNFNLKEELLKYVKNWKWFLFGVTMAMLMAYVYLRYTIPQYRAVATILVKDDRKGSIYSELSAFSDLDILSNIKNNVDNEVEVIKSRGIIQETIKELELNYLYFNLGRVRSEELYKISPIKILFVETSDEFVSTSYYYKFKNSSADSFNLYTASDELIGTYKYDMPFSLGKNKAIIVKNELFVTSKEYNIGIQILPVSLVAERFKAKLNASVLSKNTSVIELSIIDQVKVRAEDFLNGLVINYNKDAIEDKKFVAENTAKFIENRLDIISEELKDVEEEVEVFKRKNHVTDIVSEAGLFLENTSEAEKKRVEVETQIKVTKTMLDFAMDNEQFNLMPSNIIPVEEGASKLIEEFNLLVLKRNKFVKTAGEQNAVVLSLEKEIESLKQNLVVSLKQLETSLNIQLRDVKRQSAILNGRISQIPTQEKIFKDIDRKQHIKEALYLYLLQKREETAISLAVTEPNAKVIDEAKSTGQVSPNRSMILMGSLVLGLLIPFMIVYLLDLLNTKVKSRLDIEGVLPIPFLGEIPKLDSVNMPNDVFYKTPTAEALRIVRTNLNFLLNGVVEGNARTVFITSTYPKEGKTFISVFLSSIIANTDKKILLMGMDIRNPKLNEFFDMPEEGFTNFLTDREERSITEYIISSKEVRNLDILPSGIIPPNPAELLMSSKVEGMFKEVKSIYDYIIVDTAPLSLVTDTLEIVKHADAFIYIVRANYLDKRMLDFPLNLYNEKKLPNMSILLNDVEVGKRYGYGYSYGYYKPENKKRKWDFLSKKRN